MKLDVTCMRYLSKDDYRVLTAVEMGMRNHEMVPIPLITSIAQLRHGGIYKILSTLLRYKLVAHTNNEYNGYRLSYLGFDILALRALLSRNIIVSVGSQIGVGKESDIFEAQNEDGEEVVIKIHRLGRTSFRSVRKNRDCMNGKNKASWLYMSRLAAVKEYAFMRALHAHSFPVPTPYDQNRHVVVMSKVPGSPMSQIKTGRMYGAEAIFGICLGILRRLAEHGLVHCDFNEFNLMVDEHGTVTLIDFPQMVSTSHANASELFDRDLRGLVKYFAMKMRFIPPDDMLFRLEDIMAARAPGLPRIDAEVQASGVTTQEEDRALLGYIQQQGDTEEDAGEGQGEDQGDEVQSSHRNGDCGDGDRGGELPRSVPKAGESIGVEGTNITPPTPPAGDIAGCGVGGTAAATTAATESNTAVEDEELTDEEVEGLEGGEEEAEGEGEKVEVDGKAARERIRREMYRRGHGGRGGHGAGKQSRNMTKKRNKYGKIVKNGKISIAAEW